MNLGDGLMFELENGKPKLVLASYEEPKASSRVGHFQVPHKNRTQKSTVNPKQSLKEPDRPQKEKKFKEPAGVNYVDQETARPRRRTKVKVSKDHNNVIGVVRVQSESKTKTTDESKVIEKTVKESLVCLTQEQLQQILNSIKTSGQTVQEHIQNGGSALDANEECENAATGAAELLLDTNNHRHRGLQGKGNSEKKPLDSEQSGLFGTLGERELERETLEAKRAQWRRELDEQMALKKQQKVSSEVTLHGELHGRPPAGPRSNDQPLTVQDNTITRTATRTDNTNIRPAASQTHSHQKALPSAIRSAFVLGEATPSEQAFSEEKRDQQKRWLHDLEQQREEAKLRKKLEKQSQRQAEDHERWAMHFDSFQRRLPLHPPTVAASDRGEPEAGSALSHHRSPSGALSTAWEAMSAFGGDSMGRASVDTTQSFQQKSSYLRTMTALLDPAQIEERERKRIKQLEHQRAIEAQVEERRRQKEKETAARQAMEQAEEKRVAREREVLQQQYLKDTQMQRKKEELQSRKTEELYLSVQKAQEEAQKDRHLLRIKELSKKGHDVSKLLRSLEGEAASQALRGQESVSTATLDTAEKVKTFSTERKDTAVQTEANTETPFETEGIFNTGGKNQTPVIPVEQKSSPSVKRSRREARLSEKNSGKENIFMAHKEVDPYEAYARADRPHTQQPGRKPEWNTQRPSKPFVPASERYPTVLQRHRQESRMRRQMELMTLVERNMFSKTPQQEPSAHSLNPALLQQHTDSPHPKTEDSQRGPATSITQSRGHSPPIPAIKNRLQQPHQSAPLQREEETGESADSSEWPPSSDYIPYVRTDEVYHLDPLAPLSRPTTHEAQQRTHADVNSSRQPTPLIQRDPLFHPELLKSTERQQAILKGLSELRQGLLQKQRELESSLNPLLQGQSRTHSPAFQPM